MLFPLSLIADRQVLLLLLLIFVTRGGEWHVLVLLVV